MALDPTMPRPSGLSTDLAANEPTAAKADETTRAAFRYIDRPECAETFADSITGISFDGQTLRLEFSVSRMDETKPKTPLTGRRYPACRLVLPPAAAVDLMRKMQQITAALVQSGYLKPAPRAAGPNSDDKPLT